MASGRVNNQVIYNAIIRFMKITQLCYENTTYVEDKSAYKSDIALCAKWLSEINDNILVTNIIEDILDSRTAKHILDYYKQGKWGDKQAKAFVDLKNEINV